MGGSYRRQQKIERLGIRWLRAYGPFVDKWWQKRKRNRKRRRMGRRCRKNKNVITKVISCAFREYIFNSHPQLTKILYYKESFSKKIGLLTDFT